MGSQAKSQVGIHQPTDGRIENCLTPENVELHTSENGSIQAAKIYIRC